jgi:hypothetical protein
MIQDSSFTSNFKRSCKGNLIVANSRGSEQHGRASKEAFEEGGLQVGMDCSFD